MVLLLDCIVNSAETDEKWFIGPLSSDIQKRIGSLLSAVPLKVSSSCLVKEIFHMTFASCLMPIQVYI